MQLGQADTGLTELQHRCTGACSRRTLRGKQPRLYVHAPSRWALTHGSAAVTGVGVSAPRVDGQGMTPHDLVVVSAHDASPAAGPLDRAVAAHRPRRRRAAELAEMLRFLADWLAGSQLGSAPC
jgi:hypothetical protein